MDEEKLTPRSYQSSLMEIAIKQNTIIYLPTGSGKTFIALLVLKTLSGSLLRPYSDGGKISIILVNTVALVDQHAKYVKDHTFFDVGAYSGDQNTDFWTEQQWIEQFNKNQVLIMTSQIMVNIVEANFLDLSKVNLIIFDECHRGVDDHPMRQVMKKFQIFDKQEDLEPPRIIGLTATLLNGNCDLHKVMEQVKILETTFHSKVATVDGLDEVIGFSTNPQEHFKVCTKPPDNDIINVAKETLMEVINILNKVKIDEASSNSTRDIILAENLKPLEPKDVLKKLRNFIMDLVYHIETLGIFGAYKACIVYMIQIERIKKHAEEIKIFWLLNFTLTAIAWVKESLKTIMQDYSHKEKLFKFSSDKILKLFEIFKEYKNISKEELCALIFVKRRYTAKIIYHILKSLANGSSEFRHLKPNFIVGNSNNPYNDSREGLYITKKNKQTLDGFVNKEFNVLVSSNVLEEGVDIPKCTLVVKFDKFEDYRSYIQSKGRARHCSSLFYTLVEIEHARQFQLKYSTYQNIEGLLNDFLVGKNLERDSPSRSDIDSMYNEDELPPYFANGPNSAQVNMITAISLLCRYCSSIPTDSYTIYAPDWYIEQNPRDNKVRVVIVLPTVCSIYEPIVGPYMRNKKNAKRAAALYACIALHKCGELDNNLLPLKKQCTEKDVSYLFNHWPEQKESSAGFKKNKRLHDIKIADCVNENIRENTKLFLHVIKINPEYKRSENFDLATVYDLYVSPLCFGLISARPLPTNLFNFPLYDSSGQVNVEIKTNVKTVMLNEEELQEIREFHYLIFNDLLEILKEFLVFDNIGGNTDMLYVVPIQDGADPSIERSVIEEHKTLKSKQQEPTSTERINLQVCPDTYLHRIVSPWYRTQPSVYIVTRVCLEKSPSSPFPNDDYTNFEHYFRQKHSLRVLNHNQPLLLVKGLSSKLNTFKPTGINAKRKREKRYEELEEYLLPEFVVKQDFPACLWVQARFLPCILSRLSFMLKLQQLQFEIARDIGADLTLISNCPPLQLDYHLLKYEAVEAKRKDSLVISVPSQNDLLQIECSSLVTKQYNKDFALKKLEAEYPWPNIDEPKDVEREINVNILDIEQYEQFINQRPIRRARSSPSGSPIRAQNLPAITYYKDFEEKSLSILSVQYERQTPNLGEFYKALTASEGNDIVNLERLETLGDSFLKLISTLYIYFKFPPYNEGQSTELKGKLVSNKNLYYLAIKKQLGGILKNKDFSPSEDWVPPGFCVPEYITKQINEQKASITSLFYCNIQPEEQISGVLSNLTEVEITSEFRQIESDEENSYPSMCHFIKKQYVGDKTLADCVEALLGAYFQTGGFDGAVKFVEWIGIIPPSENVSSLIKDTASNPVLDTNASLSKILFHIPQWKKIEENLGYTFNNPAYLLQALTHSSYSSNRVTLSYERLEFIGDAIIDFLITCYIYEECGYLDPGQVTDLRSALVNNNTFASLVVRCGFHKFLLIVNSKLQGHIDKFAEYLAIKDFVIDDEVLILLEEQDLNLAEYIDVPKVLGDVFEALVGAVYLDSGRDFKTVWKVFYRIMWKEIELFSKNVPKNVIRRLYECHTSYPSFSKEVVLENQRVMVALEFMCQGRKKRVHGFGTNKIMAKRAAAKIALRALNL